MHKKLLAILLSTVAVAALADINVGVTVSATGPAASLGIPEKNTIELLPKTIAGQKVRLEMPVPAGPIPTTMSLSAMRCR